MTDIKVTYVFLKSLLFIVFFISGYLLSKSKNNSNYWRLALLPIITFAVISGLRFGREIDYNGYYLIYTNKYETDEMEFVFRIFINFFNFLEIPYYLFVFFCSTFLIVSFLYFLYRFRKFSFFILPLFLGLMGIENLIRWYFACSFLLVAVRLLIDKRYLFAFFLGIVAFFSHSGIIVCELVIVVFYFFANKNIINPYAAAVLFTIFVFYGSTEQLNSISTLLNGSPALSSEKFSVYTENANDIATGGMKTGIYERSFINNIRIYISYIFPIFFSGYHLLKITDKYKEFLWLYNLSIFSIIIMPVFMLVEIFNRISAALMFYSIILVGITVFYASSKKYNNMAVFSLLIISFLCLVYPIFKIPFDITNENEMLFIWDANGLNYLIISK